MAYWKAQHSLIIMEPHLPMPPSYLSYISIILSRQNLDMSIIGYPLIGMKNPCMHYVNKQEKSF